MKILIVNFEYPPLGGGGGVATQQLAKELSHRHTVHVLTSAYRNLPLEERSGRVYVHRARVLGRHAVPTASLLSMVTFVPAALWRGMWLCRAHPFDVVNAQFVIPSGVPALILAKLFGKPLVVSFIGGDLYDPSKSIAPHKHWFLRMIVRFISHQATARTAISEDTKNRARELHGVEKAIEVVHLGLVPTAVASTMRPALGLAEDKKICVSIGRLIPRKGYSILLQAWQKVPEAHLVIIGDGPLKETLRAEARALRIADRVQFVGFVSDEIKSQILQAADVYVSAAQHEGFGIVFLEAMRAGLPIVATNAGGQVDILRDGVHAYLVRPRDPAALAERINQLLANRVTAGQMGARNKIDVQKYYIGKTADKFEKILERAVYEYMY